jgi:hypothetical protein
MSLPDYTASYLRREYYSPLTAARTWNLPRLYSSTCGHKNEKFPSTAREKEREANWPQNGGRKGKGAEALGRRGRREQVELAVEAPPDLSRDHPCNRSQHFHQSHCFHFPPCIINTTNSNTHEVLAGEIGDSDTRLLIKDIYMIIADISQFEKRQSI